MEIKHFKFRKNCRVFMGIFLEFLDFFRNSEFMEISDIPAIPEKSRFPTDILKIWSFNVWEVLGFEQLLGILKNA